MLLTKRNAASADENARETAGMVSRNAPQLSAEQAASNVTCHDDAIPSLPSLSLNFRACSGSIFELAFRPLSAVPGSD